MQVTLDIPDQWLTQLVPDGVDASRSLMDHVVAGAYREGRLTYDQVRQILGFDTRIQVQAFLHLHGVSDDTAESVERDFANLRHLAVTNTRQ